MEEQDMPSSRRRDLIFALAIIAIAGLVIWEARKQPRSPYDPIGAAGVPIWTAGIMIILAGSMLVRLALGKSTTGDAKSLFTSTEAVDDSARGAAPSTMSILPYAGPDRVGFEVVHRF